jgi:L-lactate dehydrogenase (cytochrome)
VAQQVLPFKALSYYSSASDDEISGLQMLMTSERVQLTSLDAADAENARAYSRFFFYPRVLRAVGHCDPSTTILGFKSSIPVFASGAALAKLGHPEGIAEHHSAGQMLT